MTDETSQPPAAAAPPAPPAEPLEPEVLPPQGPVLADTFPELIECPQCRRPYRAQQLRTHVNTLLTEMALSCQRCKKTLIHMRLKDWYDHYIQGQPHEFELDRHGFTHKDPRDLNQPPPPPKRNPLERLSRGNNRNQPQRRPGGPNNGNNPNNPSQGQRNDGRRNGRPSRHRRRRPSGPRPAS